MPHAGRILGHTALLLLALLAARDSTPRIHRVSPAVWGFGPQAPSDSAYRLPGALWGSLHDGTAYKVPHLLHF